MYTKLITAITLILLLSNTTALARSYGSSICKQSGFTCYTARRGDTWDKLFPNSEQQDLVMRINRMNVELSPGTKIAIPTSHDTNIMDYSPLPHQINAPGEKLIYVSIHDEAFGAYDANGRLVQWGPISAARGYCPDMHHSCTTPIGKFAIYNKEGADCKSTKFPVGRGGAPMPYCMFFHGGIALHGSYELPGWNDSHGCVRMNVEDAKWLNQEFTADHPNTTVIVDK